MQLGAVQRNAVECRKRPKCNRMLPCVIGHNRTHLDPFDFHATVQYSFRLSPPRPDHDRHLTHPKFRNDHIFAFVNVLLFHLRNNFQISRFPFPSLSLILSPAPILPPIQPLRPPSFAEPRLKYSPPHSLCHQHSTVVACPTSPCRLRMLPALSPASSGTLEPEC